MKKEIKLMGLVGLFFVVAFGVVIHLFLTAKKANELFDFLIFNAQNYANREQYFPQKYYNHPISIHYFETTKNTSKKEYDFASITLKDVSPLLCSQILRRDRPFNVDVYLNDKPVFFGSDWRCFKGLKHQMRFQFSLYNLSKRFQMDEPKVCLDIWDCDVKNNETCTDGYCQKTLPTQHQSLTKK